MKKLTRVKLINWHRFTNVLIDLENSVLISGENGAGKSTLLDAIQFVVTCSTNYFNKAAHENGKRKLTGYIRCKTGRENRPYERTGEISAHVALEFYEEKRQRYFIVGAVVDSASEGQEKTVRYLMDGERLEDGLFFQGKVPKSIAQFRTGNGKKIKTWCTTDKDAKQMIKNRFGRLEDKFFKLIPKAMAFRPIDDIKDFVYSYVLDEKEVNIDILRENVRTYQDLQHTLDKIKLRMGRLEKIEAFHRQVADGMHKDQMYEYFLDRVEVDILTEEIRQLESAIVHDTYRLERWNKEIAEAQKEKERDRPSGTISMRNLPVTRILLPETSRRRNCCCWKRGSGSCPVRGSNCSTVSTRRRPRSTGLCRCRIRTTASGTTAYNWETWRSRCGSMTLRILCKRSSPTRIR